MLLLQKFPEWQFLKAGGIAVQPFYFTGTNNYNLIDATAYDYSSIYNILVKHWNEGIRVRPLSQDSTQSCCLIEIFASM